MTQVAIRRGVCAPPKDAGIGEVAAAIRDMSETDLLRLRALAKLRARGLPGGVSWSDLLNEAVLRALDGARRCPPGVPLLAFLAGVMRSLADEHWRRARRDRDLGSLEPAADADPERRLAAAQSLAAIDRLFAEDAVALKIVAGLTHGLTAEEIRARYALDQTTYDTARRRMRRTLLRHGLAWQPR